MVREIIQIGNKILNQKSEPVTDFDDKRLKTVIKDLLDTVKSNEENTVGLSAVQIGHLDRVCVCRRIDKEKLSDESESRVEWNVFINPEIKVLDPTPNLMWEGCMSIGVANEQLFGPVTRPRKVEVHYQNEAGKFKKLVAVNYMSHVFQHEVDHMDGILFLTYVRNPEKNIWKSEELDEYLEMYGEYPHIK